MDSTPTRKPAWNPKGIAWISFFFSFLPAGILYALNFERLGKPELKRPYLIGVSVAFVLFIILAVVTKDDYSKFFQLLNIIIALLFFTGQKNLFDAYVNEGGQKASFKKPVLICLGIMASLVGIAILYIFNGTKPIKLISDQFENNYISVTVPKGWRAYDLGDPDTIVYIEKDNGIANISISNETHFVGVPNATTIVNEIPGDILYDRLTSIMDDVSKNPNLGWKNFEAASDIRTSTFKGFNAAEADFLVDERIGWEKEDTTRRIRRMVIFTKNDIYNIVFAATEEKTFETELKDFNVFMDSLTIK